MAGLAQVRPLRSHADSREIQSLDAAQAAANAADGDTTVTSGSGPVNPGLGGVTRTQYAAAFPMLRATANARAAQAGDPGQAGTHENTSPNAEAGFFQPFEFPQSLAPAMNYAPPGYVEAGNRRPEDDDPRYDTMYRNAYYLNQLARAGDVNRR